MYSNLIVAIMYILDTIIFTQVFQNNIASRYYYLDTRKPAEKCQLYMNQEAHEQGVTGKYL